MDPDETSPIAKSKNKRLTEEFKELKKLEDKRTPNREHTSSVMTCKIDLVPAKNLEIDDNDDMDETDESPGYPNEINARGIRELRVMPQLIRNQTEPHPSEEIKSAQHKKLGLTKKNSD